MQNRNKPRGMDFSAPSFGSIGAATYLNVCPSLMELDRADGRFGIPYSRIGRRVVYLKVDLDAFLQRQRTVPKKVKAAAVG